MTQTTALIIGADVQLVKEISDSLQGAGYGVVLAQRALDGLDKARKMTPDVIITELDLPDMSGRELATTLRADGRFASTPVVIVLEVDTDVEQRELSLVAGVTGFIEKPINAEALVLQMEFYLSGGEESVGDDERLDEARTRYMQEFVTRLETRIRDLEKKNSDLEKLDQTKDAFIQLTAHELRTPLTLITGYGRLLQDQPQLNALAKQDPSFAGLMDGLEEAIGRMQSIIEEVLTVSRMITNQIELNVVPINLADVVQRVIDKYLPAIQERQLTLMHEREQWPTRMWADEDLLRLTLDNLLSNAIKYTPNGGQIELSAQYTEKLLRFSVRDTGIGIAPERQEQIFERLHIGGDVGLHTTSKTAYRGGGLGLGLAICRGIIEAHGGKIRVDSPGHDPINPPGSTFIVVLSMENQQAGTGKRKVKRLALR